jgi:hypothetical protein
MRLDREAMAALRVAVERPWSASRTHAPHTPTDDDRGDGMDRDPEDRDR